MSANNSRTWWRAAFGAGGVAIGAALWFAANRDGADAVSVAERLDLVVTDFRVLDVTNRWAGNRVWHDKGEIWRRCTS